MFSRALLFLTDGAPTLSSPRTTRASPLATAPDPRKNLKPYAYQRYANVEVQNGRLAAQSRYGDTLYHDGDRLVMVFTSTVEAADLSEARQRVWAIHSREDRPDAGAVPAMAAGDVVVLRQLGDGGRSVAFGCEQTGWSMIPFPTNIDPRFWVEVMEEL